MTLAGLDAKMKITQQNKILELLRTNEKVNSHDLTYKYSIKQAPTRIHELREQGHTILKSQPLKNGSVDYYMLTNEPEVTVPEYSPKSPNKGRTITYINNGVREQITI